MSTIHNGIEREPTDEELHALENVDVPPHAKVIIFQVRAGLIPLSQARYLIEAFAPRTNRRPAKVRDASYTLTLADEVHTGDLTLEDALAFWATTVPERVKTLLAEVRAGRLSAFDASDIERHLADRTYVPLRDRIAQREAKQAAIRAQVEADLKRQEAAQAAADRQAYLLKEAGRRARTLES